MRPEQSRRFTEPPADISTDAPFPSPSAIEASLKVLRKSPLDAERVRQRVDLLLVPFVRRLDSHDRAEHFIRGVAIASKSLSASEKVVLDHVFFGSSTEGIGKRRDKALQQLIEEQQLKRGKSIRAVTSIEEKALSKLAAVLASPDFADTYATVENLPSQQGKHFSEDLPDLVKLRYCWSIDFDTSNERRQISDKLVLIRATRSAQVVFLDRYYTTGSRPAPESVEKLSEDESHEWMDAKPELRPGRPSMGWWHNIFHLGKILESGETRTIGWQETFWDEEGSFTPLIAFVATPGLETITLALRLPPPHRSRSAEARITADPMHRRDTLEKWPCEPDKNGWCIEQFTNLKADLEYGIYFPTSLKLYS